MDFADGIFVGMAVLALIFLSVKLIDFYITTKSDLEVLFDLTKYQSSLSNEQGARIKELENAIAESHANDDQSDQAEPEHR